MERKRFYEVARSSVVEIDSQLEAGLILKYIAPQNCVEINVLIMEEFRMLTKMTDG